HRPFEQGARTTASEQVGEGFAEGLLILQYRRDRFSGSLATTIRSARASAIIDAISVRKPPSLADARERTCFAVASRRPLRDRCEKAPRRTRAPTRPMGRSARRRSSRSAAGYALGAARPPGSVGSWTRQREQLLRLVDVAFFHAGFREDPYRRHHEYGGDGNVNPEDRADRRDAPQTHYPRPHHRRAGASPPVDS